MSNPTSSVPAALPVRLGLWMRERFPPATYTILVAVYGLAGLSVGWATGGTRWGLAALLVVWLFFLHLRILDEHKDFARDRLTHPDRVLSRGVVTLRQLAGLGAVAFAIQAALAISLGVPAFIAWLASIVFSVAMFVEFGVGAWLSRHIVLYALTHNPVMFGIAAFVVLATGAPLAPAHLGFLVLSSVSMLGFEFARKIYLGHEEHPDVPSYTSELGQKPARLMLLVCHLGTGVALAATLGALAVSPLLIAAAVLVSVVPGVLTALPGQPAKRVELGASLVLLVSLLCIGLLCWTVP